MCEAGRRLELSVIIPVYNGALSIVEQLGALKAQQVDFCWEVIVADNGSTDDTRAVVEEQAKTFPVPLRVVDASQRRGAAHARNIGVAASKGEHLAMCDCDDVVGPRWLAAAQRQLVEHDVVIGPLIPIFGSTDSGEQPQQPVLASFGFLIASGNFGIRKTVYSGLGGMDETLPPYGAEDSEFSIRVNEGNLRIVVDQELLLYFRPTPVGHALVRKVYRAGQAEVAVWRRHPIRFANRLGFVRALGRVATLPVYAARVREIRGTTRESLLRLGHLSAQLPWRTAAPSHLPVRAIGSDTRRRVLWVTPVADLGGVARHILDVTRVGIPGWHVTVLCPEGPLAERLRAQGAAVVTGQFGAGAGALASCRTLSRVAKSLRPDIVHSHLAYADIINAWTPLPKGTRRFTTEHGIADDDGVYHRSTLQSKGMALVHRARFPRFGGVIAVSQATRKAMLDKWKVKQPITVILNGANLPEGVTRREADTVSGLRILSLSRLASEKRIDKLIDAFALVKAEHPDSTLTIAGEGPQRRALEAQAARLGLGASVRFPGFMDPDQAMAEADVLVQLSVWENCSYTIMDAALRGLRLVASDAGGNREVLGRTGVLQETNTRGVADSILNAKNVGSRSLTSVEDMCRSLVRELYRRQG